MFMRLTDSCQIWRYAVQFVNEHFWSIFSATNLKSFQFQPCIIASNDLILIFRRKFIEILVQINLEKYGIDAVRRNMTDAFADKILRKTRKRSSDC